MLTSPNLLPNPNSYLRDITRMKGRYEIKYAKIPMRDARFVRVKNEPTKKLKSKN